MSTTDITPPVDKKPLWRRWLLEGLIFLILFIAFQIWQVRDTARGAAPAFTAQQIDGQPFDLTAWRARNPGKATLLYFWAEWCPVCKTTAGNITNISNDWPVMTIATQSGSAAQVASYMQKNNYRWPTVNDPKAEILRQFGLPGTPAFVIITPAGEIQFVSIGFTSEIGLRLRLWWASRESS